MRNILIKSISDTIRSMEQGKFQEFCMDLLPVYDSRYKGLKRHGGTAEGKTRKGTPDSIKTLGTGTQIFVQCSVDKKYWKIPRDEKKYPKWKPCNDIDKCIKSMQNIDEIILCSSQEIPTNSQNAEAEIITYAAKKTSAKIRIFSCADFENILITNTEDLTYEPIFKRNLPSVYTQIASLRETQKYKLACELLKERPISVTEALNIATETIELKEGKSYALGRVEELKSKFERIQPPDKGFVERQMQTDFPIFHPIGKIVALIGVPKIGKTMLVAQCAERWKSYKLRIRWFNCPINEVDTANLIQDICKEVWKSFLPIGTAVELASGTINNDSLNLKNLRYKHNYPTVFVLDNTEFLNLSAIKSICRILEKLKSSSILSQIGFVFIGNKKLKYICPVISDEIPAPPWSNAELVCLIKRKVPGVSILSDKRYLEALKTFSSGHPLIAVAFARKFPTIEELTLSSLKGPSISDEDLGAEVKNLLFNDILIDDEDALSYVLRMSCLVFPVKNVLIDTIKNCIEPKIAKPFSLVLDKLGGTVIEGDEHQGYNIAFVYREVAKNMLGKNETRMIFDKASSRLLKSEKEVIDANNVIEGIYYSLFSAELERALHWAAILLFSLKKQPVSKAIMKTILHRLELVAFIDPPDDENLLLNYNTVVFLIGIFYFRIGCVEKAINFLNRVVSHVSKDSHGLAVDFSISLREISKLLSITLIAMKDPQNAIRMLSTLEINRIDKILLEKDLNLANLLLGFVLKLPIAKIDENVFRKVTLKINLENDASIVAFIEIAFKLAVRSQRENENPQKVIQLLSETGKIRKMLSDLFYAQLSLEEKNSADAKKYINLAIVTCKEIGLWFGSIESIIQQVKGDILYKASSIDEAKAAYLRSLELSQEDTFNYAWANYRLGLISEKPEKGLGYFERSSITFEKLKYYDLLARSEGERGIALVQLNRLFEFIRIAEWMARRYFFRSISTFGPSTTVIMSQLTRLIFYLNGKRLPVDEVKIYVDFQRNTYPGILEIAKPQFGCVSAFYSLGTAYDKLNNIDRKIKCYRTALRFKAETDVEKRSVPFIVCELLNELVPHGNESEIRELMQRCITFDLNQVSLITDKESKVLLSYCAFSKLDKKIDELDNVQRVKFANILSELSRWLSEYSVEESIWWNAEILLRKAKIEQLTNSNPIEKFHLWKKTYDSGIKSSNNEVIIQAGYALGFLYCDRYTIKALADVQFSILKATDSQGEGEDRLGKIGQDLYRLWKVLDYKRLSEDDIDAKHLLMDSAKTLDSQGFTFERASPIMILLLCRIYNFKGDATKWAIKRIKSMSIESKIPKDLRNELGFYLIGA